MSGKEGVATRQDYQWRWRPLEELPEGTISLVYFAIKHNVAKHVINSHISDGIKGERIEVTRLPAGRQMRRYLTPDQQRKAMAFWDRHGIKYRKPAEKVEVRP